MQEIFETIMLICFGCSWPVAVIKNMRAKSARAMSLNFILLIIIGYLAGITAKLMDHKYNYVLIVYLINLVFVSVNLGVYFRNRHLDRRRV